MARPGASPTAPASRPLARAWPPCHALKQADPAAGATGSGTALPHANCIRIDQSSGRRTLSLALTGDAFVLIEPVVRPCGEKMLSFATPTNGFWVNST